MDEKFYKEWFLGFAEGLDRMNEESRSGMLRCCARRCADTGVLDSYRNHYKKVGGNKDEFYSRLEELGGVRGEVAVSGKEYLIIFLECCCDLHTTGGVHTPNLCECSKQSILYVGKEVWGKDVAFSVCQEGTILTGKKECTFRIVFEDDKCINEKGHLAEDF